MSRAGGWIAGTMLLAAFAAGCQERFTAPAECPQLCPGGESQVFDTVLSPVIGRDSTFTGYVAAGAGVALLVSNGLPASESRAVTRFSARADSIEVRDTLRSYVVDSALIQVNLVARDTLSTGLRLYLYRIDPAVDSTVTFASLAPQLTPATLLDSILVPDSVNTGPLTKIFRGADVAKVALPTGGGGVLALGFGVAADQPTGIRIGSRTNTTGATFISYLTVDVPDTTTALRKQAVTGAPAFNTFVSQTPLVPDPAFLTVGGEPSSRALVRFSLPEVIRDSATIIRATLALIPRQPILGLPTDPAFLNGSAIVADLGAKSPVTIDNRFIVTDTLPPGIADTVRLDVTRLVQLWQSPTERPAAIFLSLLLSRSEAASFMRPQFGSTRSDPAINPGTPEPVGAPRLRITYQRPFPFESP